MSDNDTETLIASQQFTQLMKAITSSQARMEAKFAEFRSEVRQGQEDAAARALKRACHEKPYSFKRKGNEEQASFNSKVDESITEAKSELAEAGPSSTPSFQRALQALQKGRELIAKRQKLIKIAHRSDHCWSVVAEYTTDELANNSDDKKWLEKAERAAEQKAVKRRKKRASAALWKPFGQPGPTALAAAGPSSIVAQPFSQSTIPKPSTPGLPVRRPQATGA